MIKSPLHKLKEIKPLLHLHRDEAILLLFIQIYSILKEELTKYSSNKFLFIPISGKHLHDADGTKEHFFLTGAPIGIFNYMNDEDKIEAISSILSYTLYNRKYGLSATNLLSKLQINGIEESIISYAKISFGENNEIEIEKNYSSHPKSSKLNTNLLDIENWNTIKEQVKKLITLDNSCYVEVPNLDGVLENVTSTLDKSENGESHFEYIISNLFHFGNSSELKTNYYFPSFHFIERKNQPDSSYGFFVVSTNDKIIGSNAADNPIDFLERVALVVFSLVGIIEQHYFVKIEQHKPIIKEIKYNSKNLLPLLDKINNAELDKSILLTIGTPEIINSINHLEKFLEKTSNDDDIKEQVRQLKNLFFGESSSSIFSNLKMDLRTELVKFYEVIESIPTGFTARLGHADQNISHNYINWNTYQECLESFISIKELDTEIYNSYFFPIIEALSKREEKILSPKIELWETNFSKTIIYPKVTLFTTEKSNLKFKALTNKKIFFEGKDWKKIIGLITENYTRHSTNDKTSKPEFKLTIYDTDSSVSFLFAMQDEPLSIDEKANLRAVLNSGVVEENRLTWLKYLICNKYSGILEFVNINDTKECINFENQNQNSEWEVNNTIEYAKGFYYKLIFK